MLYIYKPHPRSVDLAYVYNFNESRPESQLTPLSLNNISLVAAI